MERKLVVAGLGGQGVVFVTRVLTRAVVSLGHPVMASENHGMSQRGGSVLSHLRIGGGEAPLILRGTADLLLALEPEEAVRNLSFVRRGGAAVVSAEDGIGSGPEVAAHLDRLRIRLYTVPADRIAAELGRPAVANTVLVGFAVSLPDLPLPEDALRTALETFAPRSVGPNIEALDAGLRAGRAALGAGSGQPGTSGGVE